MHISNRIVVDSETQALILKTLEDLPPKSWLGEHLTRDQMIYWSDLMMVNTKLYILFEDYFNGKENSARTKIWEKKTRKLMEVERDYYLSFYQMLQIGWEYIEPATTGWNYPALMSAGEAVVKAIYIDCSVSFSTCFTYFTFPKSEVYNLYREEKKIRQLLNEKQKLSTKEENNVNQFITKLRHRWKPFEQSFLFEKFLTLVCADAAKNDPELRLALINFCDQAQLRHETLMRRVPETQGFAWDGKGHKLSSTKAGGVYK